MLFLDGVYVERPGGSLGFRRVKAPTSAELARLTQTLAQRIGRYRERQGLLERDADDCKDAGGTTPRMGEVELSPERKSRAMQEQLPRTRTWLAMTSSPVQWNNS